MAFLNKRSPAFKDRDLGSKTLTKAQVIQLMMEDVNLIRRPIVMRGPKSAVFGYNAEEYDELA
jgi:arsenate reductase-like glutaredoxin family protein